MITSKFSKNSLNFDLQEASCVVRYNGYFNGFLFTHSGYIFTVGHPFIKNDQNNENINIFVNFEKEEIPAILIHAAYDYENWLDYAIIKISEESCNSILPLPVCFEPNYLLNNMVWGTGSEHKNGWKSIEVGVTNIIYGKNKQPGFYNYYIDSLKEGFSGSLIFNQIINAAIGIHCAKSREDLSGTSRYGMPLSRILENWPPLKEILDHGSYVYNVDNKKGSIFFQFPNSHKYFRNIVKVDNTIVVTFSLNCNSDSVHINKCNIFDKDVLYKLVSKKISDDYEGNSKVQRNGNSTNVIFDLNQVESKNYCIEKILFLITEIHETITKEFEVSQCECSANKTSLIFRKLIGVSSGCCYFDGQNYFGSVVDESKEIMDKAWPDGITIPDNLLGESISQIIDAIIAKKPKFVFNKENNTILRFNQKKEIKCFSSTSSINWKCIAWPGFEHITIKSDKYNTLNSIGITFLTHEGLNGNFKTLQLWPGGSKLKRGNQFDLIIEDYDSLAIKYFLKELDILENTMFEEMGELIINDFFELPSVSNNSYPYFIPMRCGLNALAYDDSMFPECDMFDTYFQIYEHCLKNKYVMAIYDNFGSFMPILISIYFGSKGKKINSANDIYDITPIDVEGIIEWLRNEQESRGSKKLFRMYSNMDNLSNAIFSGQPSVVLGGGAWLCKARYKNKIKIYIPKDDFGFVWIEGGSIRKHAEYKEDIEKFIYDNILSEEFQDDIANLDQKGYISFPVISSSISKLEKSIKSLSAEDQSFSEVLNVEFNYLFQSTEVKGRNRIFNHNDNNTIIRKAPKYIDKWIVLWQHVRNNYSEMR